MRQRRAWSFGAEGCIVPTSKRGFGQQHITYFPCARRHYVFALEPDVTIAVEKHTQHRRDEFGDWLLG